ncbi:DUF58 domain-containing protein [Phragmitibacter flavus]|uniref:DUF58 domain-containing protein n=1 Tax=Phragmitibacter flavus TaxID=2576071 RepID=A0A5R8K9W0_9BACT|nr:DUF58 domain-containing protein [Phragmitibacter flavus]TLD68705.1 DUF58 domain-containing protein [Phragmitibacter flavus]
MSELVDKVLLREVHQRMKAVTGVARLPLGTGQWSGVSGSVLGQGTGSSVDFHDQRPYLPGDDPRHINWQAFARTGSYTMKLYRQEVTPRVDVLFDGSASMFLTETKARRSWELLFFCVESGLRLGASVKVWGMGSRGVEEWPMERLLAYEVKVEGVVKEKEDRARALMVSEARLRAGSLRVWISDLLFAEAPAGLVAGLTRERGRGVVLVPTCVEEAHPDWTGNIEFDDCERGWLDRRRVEGEVMDRYLKAYARHFALWREECTRRGTSFARVPSEGEFLSALRVEAMVAGAVLKG